MIYFAQKNFSMSLKIHIWPLIDSNANKEDVSLTLSHIILI